MLHPICLFRTLYRSIRIGNWVSGHDYQTIDDPTPSNVHVCRCSICGDITISWSWGSLEACKGPRISTVQSMEKNHE